ncbi:YebC/PmpR family DNA-binding transcriptional regulator [Solitalea canadensis]|uniref:Probable transcriptional regulatory protein Solca_0663 n=1 Tax=Solitalea canadensis (strain ATCC 29591 / DSM 3403 / JCM 21819 / LMG 8368 / NBRC 15130 / NCIMB 12057 / USAM 9D) TaxID=929556 RepID=H8KY50_SOLCM|nr:YebC/PmpR family DNA-binding transcriptional regulator [Solitalea canadensis]AFD05788.1 DNA-binding regulatory protein, YebC/PmpR family [Solitalea canadensis DSM 3403]
MGRAFEARKQSKMKRWGKMAKLFTRIGKDIVIAVKAGGPNPESNARLRVIMQNAKGANMPKDRIEAAIKRATDKDTSNYEEIVYEGYGPYKVAILVETSTDNINRTVGNVRSYITRSGGTLGTSGLLNFIFERKAVFRIAADGVDVEELELDLIDFGAEEVFQDENEITITTEFEDFGKMQKALEDKGFNIISSEFERFCTTYKEVTAEQEAEVQKLIDKLEEDDDVNAVYHNMAPREE